MVGVFWLPAFSRLGHECQDLLSPCDGTHVCTDYESLYTLIRKSLEGMESELMLTLRKKNPYRIRMYRKQQQEKPLSVADISRQKLEVS